MPDELQPAKRKSKPSTTSTERQAHADAKKQNRERMKIANADKTKWRGWEPIKAEAILAQQRADMNGEVRHNRMLSKRAERPSLERGPFGNSSCPICCMETQLRITLEKHWLRGKASTSRINHETGLEVVDIQAHMNTHVGMRLRNLISVEIMKEDGGLLGEAIGLARQNIRVFESLLEQGDANAAAKFSANANKGLELVARLGKLLEHAPQQQVQPVIVIANQNTSIQAPDPSLIGRNQTSHREHEALLVEAAAKRIAQPQVFPALTMSQAPDGSHIIPTGSMIPDESELSDGQYED